MATRNYVPRANGEGSIGTAKKHWGVAFFDNLAVKTLEVIGGGAENDAQPATVGWVKQKIKDLLRQTLVETGLRVQFGENGYICFGEIFNKFTIQWGLKTAKVLNDFSYVEIQYPISFSQQPAVIPSVAENNSNENAGFIMAEASASVEKATFVIRSNGKTTNDFRMRWLAVGFC